jgi:transcriptional regulator with XRE-family HTH domain
MTHTERRLRALRLEVGLTQARLAEVAGLPRPDVARLESGALKCSLAATRRKLARAYGVSLDLFDSYLEGERSLAEVVAAHKSSAGGVS